MCQFWFVRHRGPEGSWLAGEEHLSSRQALDLSTEVFGGVVHGVRARPVRGCTNRTIFFLDLFLHPTAGRRRTPPTMNNSLPDPNPDFSLQSLASRRGFLRRASIAGAAAAFAPAAASLLLNPTSSLAASATDVDADVLNFALNLEYLEAEYYSYAVFGQSIEDQSRRHAGRQRRRRGRLTVSSPTAQVPFTNPIVASLRQGNRPGRDQPRHVPAHGAGRDRPVVGQPPLDLLNSFNTAAQAAGIGPSVRSVCQRRGLPARRVHLRGRGRDGVPRRGARSSRTRPISTAAAGILAVEAYHASEVRTVLYGMSQRDGGPRHRRARCRRSPTCATRWTARDKDQGIVDSGRRRRTSCPPTRNSLALARTTRKVLNIVYGAKHTHSGLFFPSGMNGAIK